MGSLKKIYLDFKLKLNSDENIVYNNRNFILRFSRKFMFVINIPIFTLIFNNYLIIGIFTSYVFNRIFWDIFIYWYILDFLQGDIIQIEHKKIGKQYYKNLTLLEFFIKNYKQYLPVFREIMLDNLFSKKIKYYHKLMIFDSIYIGYIKRIKLFIQKIFKLKSNLILKIFANKNIIDFLYVFVTYMILIILLIKFFFYIFIYMNLYLFLNANLILIYTFIISIIILYLLNSYYGRYLYNILYKIIFSITIYIYNIIYNCTVYMYNMIYNNNIYIIYNNIMYIYNIIYNNIVYNNIMYIYNIIYNNIVYNNIMYIYNIVYNNIMYIYNIVYNNIMYIYNIIYNNIMYVYNIIYNNIMYVYNIIYNIYLLLTTKYNIIKININNMVQNFIENLINFLLNQVFTPYNYNQILIKISDFNKFREVTKQKIKNIPTILNSYYNEIVLELIRITLPFKIQYKILIISSKLNLTDYYNNTIMKLIYKIDYLSFSIINNNKYYRRNISKLYIKKKEKKIKNYILLFIKNINMHIKNLMLRYSGDCNLLLQNYKFIFFYDNKKQTINLNNHIHYYICFIVKIFFNNILIKILEIFKLNNYIYIIINFNQNFKIPTISTYSKKINKFSYNFNILTLNYTQITNFFLLKIKYSTLMPFLVLNYIFSDFALSVTFLRRKYSKKINKLKLKIFKLNILIKKLKNLIIKFSTLFYSKTIYITFLYAYPFNHDAVNVIYCDFYIIYILKMFKNKMFIYYFDSLFNIKVLYIIFTIIGLLLTIKWSKSVHSFYGRYLWSMTIFPIFLETHRTLYCKLFFMDMFNFDNITFVVLLKLNFIEMLNYKIHNIFMIASLIILFIVFYKTFRLGAYKSIYSNFKAFRWHFVIFPIIIIVIEVFRFKIIYNISLWTTYLNCKYKTYLYILIPVNKIYLRDYLKETYWFVNEFIIDLENFDVYYFTLAVQIANPYLLSALIDFLMILITLKYLVIYCKMFLKKDSKYVAFPLLSSEVLVNYAIKYYIFYYVSYYTYVWSNDGRLIWYGMQSLFILFFYLEMRVHKIPKKTMPWYFRQIVELWPYTCNLLWATPKQIYLDQQRYLSMRQKFRTVKKNYKEHYHKTERWEKKVTIFFQRDKELYLYLFGSFCELMSRKENMLREFNIFDYQGWQDDWTYNCKNINTFGWKLDWWDKPYIYFFKKLIYLSNVRFYYFCHYLFIYRFACKFNHLNPINLYVNLLDYFYTNIYIHIYRNPGKYHHISKLLFRGKKYKQNCSNWKTYAHGLFDAQEELVHLRKLKIVLMEFSCGIRFKTPDWVFPPIYEKRYKKEGWKMFEDSAIDRAPLDWRPGYKKW